MPLLILRCPMHLISAAQIRAARHLASLSQADVAKGSGLSLPTIKRAESERKVSISADAIARIQTALETAGIAFMSNEDGGPGVRLWKGRRRRRRR